MERPFLYTIEEIFGNKANSTIRMYAIKIVSNFFHLKQGHFQNGRPREPLVYKNDAKLLTSKMTKYC